MKSIIYDLSQYNLTWAIFVDITIITSKIVILAVKRTPANVTFLVH